MTLQKPEWFKLDPAKFLSDSEVDSMTTLELGACFRLLCRQWLDGFIPEDERSMARLARLDNTVMPEVCHTLCRFFPVVEPGKRANRFMWIEREKVVQELERRSDDGAKAANKRWEEYRKNRYATPNADTPPDPMPHPMQEQSRAEAEQNKNTHLPPKGGRKRSRGGFSLDYPQEILDLAARLKSKWPTQSIDGSPVRIDTAKFVGNLAAIVANNPKVPLQMLEAGAEMYLGQEKPPKRWKAPQFYFGPGEDPPVSIVYARAAYTKQKQENPNAQAS